MSVKIAVGLGNVGDRYAATRHNTGANLVRTLAAALGARMAFNKYCNAFVGRADTLRGVLYTVFLNGYMNESGVGLKKVLSFLKLRISDCAVVYDDITLPAGGVKLSKGGSCGGHNGVRNIMDVCGCDFVRVRAGIGAKPDKRMDLADYVLANPSAEDALAISKIDITGIFSSIMSMGFEKAQNIYNRRADTPKSETSGAKPAAKPERGFDAKMGV